MSGRWKVMIAGGDLAGFLGPAFELQAGGADTYRSAKLSPFPASTLSGRDRLTLGGRDRLNPDGLKAGGGSISPAQYYFQGVARYLRPIVADI